nr:MAG TPA: hypothetical protein [Caudoviricetes sp.]
MECSGVEPDPQPRPETPMKLFTAHLLINLIPVGLIPLVYPADFSICNTFKFQDDLLISTLRNLGYIAECFCPVCNLDTPNKATT